MTAQPEPNQVLTAESAKLLREDDLLRVEEPGAAFNKGDVVPFVGIEGGNLLTDVDMCGVRPFPAAADRFTFIGRPDAEGWIPNPGFNPLPEGVCCEVQFSDGSTLTMKSGWAETFGWNPGQSLRIMRYRLIPHKDGEGGLGETAPLQGSVPTEQSVEAAGQPETAAWRVRTSDGFGGFLSDTYPDNAKQLLRQGYTVEELVVRSHPVAAEGEVAGLREAAFELSEATTQLLRAVNFCEPTKRLNEVMSAEDRARSAVNVVLPLAGNVSTNAVGTDGEAGSLLTIPPTTQERIALLQTALEASVRAYVIQADAASNDGYSEIAHKRAEQWRALLDHREER